MKTRAVKRSRPYRGKVTMLKKPRATISQAGVGGAKAQMSTGLALPQEVKSIDVVINVSPATPDWSIASGSALSAITLGTADNQRIGRKIRLVGILVRGIANTEDAISGVGGNPFTMDLIQDQQSNGAVAAVTTMYQAAGGNSLPNSNFQQRFRWLVRKEYQSANTNATRVNITYKCNILVSYDASTGAATDLEKNNILLTWCGVDTSPNFQGIIRFMYVDA